MFGRREITTLPNIHDVFNIERTRPGRGITNSIIGITEIVAREEQVIGSIYLDDRWPFTYFPIGIPSILSSLLGRNTIAGSLLLDRLKVKCFFRGIIVCIKSVTYSIHFTHIMFGKHYLSQT
ncbi:hypothetical protein HMPREF1870_00244 [Bacteroidales bacterium KA00344]|nr:hypothetical protein HMPREF1870_00244 [Bacteroidales bacterium KA00344]